MPGRERFEIGRTLGQGTFGVTRLARERTTGRAVAIKSLPLVGLPEWRPVELFEREARVLRSLDHPGVPAFVDAFEDDDEEGRHCFFIVCEFVDGPTLQAEITAGRRWSTEQARALFRGLAETLAYLHSLSPRVIHRDIKPGNVVLRSDGSPVLVDFGSVRDLAARGPDGGLTIAGTAGYMAPEQAMGTADVRSDLYGLAATMAHALTHVHPSELPRRGLRPQLADLAGLDPDLARLLEQMLDPEPERRPASAADVLRVLAGELPRPGAAIARRRSDESTALARPDVDPQAALALLQSGPREIGPEIEARLGFGRALGQSVPLSMGLFALGCVVSLLIATRVSLVLFVPLMLASVAAVFIAPLPKLRQSRELWATGEVTTGQIVEATWVKTQLIVKYAYRVDRAAFSGKLATSDALVANRVSPDTPLFVFYDRADPARHTALLVDELPKQLRERASGV